MRTLRAWLLRFRGLFNKPQRDRELSAELDSHLRNNIEDNLRAGMTPEEARRQALIKLGGVEQTKENYRDRRGIPWFESLLQDLRYTFRTLRKDRAFAIFAILIVGLGHRRELHDFQRGEYVASSPASFSRSCKPRVAGESSHVRL